jgi:hypothetical protein
VLWLVTTGTAASKYATRFRSQAALATPDVRELRHEHVYTRRSLVAQMLADPDSIEDVIRNKAVACTVTKAEHDLLTPFDRTHEGWARYLAAGVVVLDMATGEPVDLGEAN